MRILLIAGFLVGCSSPNTSSGDDTDGGTSDDADSGIVDGDPDGDPGLACNPLDDNYFGKSTKTGTACGTATTGGCYGDPNPLDPNPVADRKWFCSTVGPTTLPLVHRQPPRTGANGAFINGCAPGYVPGQFLNSLHTYCVAFCKPGNTYAGNPGTQYPAGQSPHGCNTTDAAGSFNTATTTNNGDHCVYSWFFERDASGVFTRSPTSDTVGFCIDHSTAAGGPWPSCASLPLTAGAGLPKAADYGCVDSVTAGL